MITEPTRVRQPTRQRLLEAGIRLFAENGFRETTVGDIEAAAGLQPRRGALYRHFSTKEALLQAALEEHLRVVAGTGATFDLSPDADLRDEAMAMGRWLLAELDRERPIMRILEQDGERLADLRDSFRQSLVDAGYVVAADVARRWLGDTTEAVDVEAVAAVLFGGLINFRRSTWTFAATPLGLDEERYLSAWAGLCSATAAAWRQRRAEPTRPTRARGRG